MLLYLLLLLVVVVTSSSRSSSRSRSSSSSSRRSSSSSRSSRSSRSSSSSSSSISVSLRARRQVSLERPAVAGGDDSSGWAVSGYLSFPLCKHCGNAVKTQFTHVFQCEGQNSDPNDPDSGSDDPMGAQRD